MNVAPRRTSASLLALTLLAASCGGGGDDEPLQTAQDASTPLADSDDNRAQTLQIDVGDATVDALVGTIAAPSVVTLTSGLVNPWSLAFLPDGSMLVTERPGRLRRVGASGSPVSAPISGLPQVDARGQGGLFDVVLDPDFATNRRIYLSYAEASGSLNGTAVARAVLSADYRSLSQVVIIFRQQPKKASTAHFGGRMVFRPDRTLYLTLGDRSAFASEAQNPSNHLGKVLRISRYGGGTVQDNPFFGRQGYATYIWSLGHRNVQGAALHPTTGELWTHEHGPQGGDEVNVTRAGKNYGWPLASYGCQYGTPVGNCTPVGGRTSYSGTVQPLTYWVPTSIAPSGMAFYTGSRYPQWQGNLFVGALAGKALWRLTLSGNSVISRERLFANLGHRIRDVRQGPDGYLYLLTDSTNGRILRIQ